MSFLPAPFSLNLFVLVVGMSIPAIVLGRSALGVALIIGLICIPLIPNCRDIWDQAVKSARTLSGALILVTLVTWIPSFGSTSDLLVSTQTLVRSLFFIGASVLIWSTLDNNKQRHAACLKVVAVASVVLIGFSVMEMKGMSELVRYIRGHANDGMKTDIMLKEVAMSGAILMPMLVWIAFRLGGVWILVCGIAIVESLWLTRLTLNRSAMAGILASMIVVGLIATYRLKSKPAKIAIVTIVIGCCISFFMWLSDYYIPFFEGNQEDLFFPVWLIDPQRQEIWSFSWQASEVHRWFGVGINNIDKVPAASEWNLETGTRNIPLHPHNWVIEVAVETGLIGLAAMLTTIGYMAYRFVWCYLHSGDATLLAVVGVWAAYWSSSLFSVSYWSSWMQVTFLVTTAICLASRHSHPN